MEVDKAVVLIQCAEINMDNLAKMIPGLADHPMFKVVKMQLESACSVLDPTQQSMEGGNV